MTTIKYISIGEYCMPALIIRDILQKRNEAYPFDWVFSKLFTIKNSVKNDFTEIKKIIKQKTNHNINEQIYFCVAHHDLKKKEDAEHYERTIIRFLENVNNIENNIIFIHSSYFINYIDKDRIAMLNEIYNLIKEKYICSFKIITIVFKKGDTNLFVIDKDENIYVITIYTIVEQELKNWIGHVHKHASLISSAINECVNMI